MLLNWKFDNHDLIIRDLKKTDALKKSHDIVKKIYSQYQEFLDNDVKEEFNPNELQRIFLFADDKNRKDEALRVKDERYFIQQKKVFIETEFISKAKESILTKFFAIWKDPILDIIIKKRLIEYEKKIYEKREVKRILRIKKIKEFLAKRKEKLKKLKKKTKLYSKIFDIDPKNIFQIHTLYFQKTPF